MTNNIILLFGGNSVEHEISIITALQVKRLYKGKYNLIPCYLKNGNFYMSPLLENIETYKNIDKNINKLVNISFIANSNYIKYKHKRISFDAIWVVAHGCNCEDGTLYAFFKTLNIDVIAESILPAAIGQDKIASKKCCGVNTLPYYEIDKYIFDNNLKDIISFCQKTSFPIILKPCNLGSSVGISEVNNIEELVDKIEELLNISKTVIIEKKLNNFVELNIAALKYKNNLILSEIEKVSNNKVLSYNDKYVNSDKSMVGQNRELPALISSELREQICDVATKIYNNLKASYIVRMDFLYDIESSTLYFNEINNIPGSLALYLFKNIGYSETEIIDMLLDEGLKNNDYEKRIITSYKNNIFKEGNISNVKLFK